MLLNKYEDTLTGSTKEISNALKHKGLIELKDKLLGQLTEIMTNLLEVENKLKKEKNKRKNYYELKKQINEKYFQLMSIDKFKFELKEIDNKNFKDIKHVFIAGGSNKPISTVIWYFNLLRVKYEFNPSVIKFTLVFDSPNNVELDEEKRKELFKYLFTNINDDTQIIISTLGFDKKDYKNIKFNKIIELDNNKYELLNIDEYENNTDLLLKLSSIISLN